MVGLKIVDKKQSKREEEDSNFASGSTVSQANACSLSKKLGAAVPELRKLDPRESVPSKLVRCMIEEDALQVDGGSEAGHLLVELEGDANKLYLLQALLEELDELRGEVSVERLAQVLLEILADSLPYLPLMNEEMRPSPELKRLARSEGVTTVSLPLL